MAKQDVLDAINATIVENGKKGITAQSLNNILTMIVENAGEGGGSLSVFATENLTENQKSHNAEVYAKCLECFNNNKTLPVIMIDQSSYMSELAGGTVSATMLAFAAIFTPTEIEGMKGLLLEAPSLTVIVSEDGSIIIE